MASGRGLAVILENSSYFSLHPAIAATYNNLGRQMAQTMTIRLDTEIEKGILPNYCKKVANATTKSLTPK